MTLMEAVRKRHSVRKYTDRPLEGDILLQFQQEIKDCAKESGLQIELCLNEPKAFSGILNHYGWLSGVKNYILLACREGEDADERVGYFGEKLVLYAQQLGLNTCWVAGTYKKGHAAKFAAPSMRLVCVITVGYGKNQGHARRSKSMEQLSRVNGEMPDWFRNGMEAAMLAPTAINQQKFRFELNGNKVHAVALPGPYSKIDLGIVKYHFEIGAGEVGWEWDY